MRHLVSITTIGLLTAEPGRVLVVDVRRPDELTSMCW